jgi:hypothetical protein
VFESLLSALGKSVPPVELASAITFAAARRITRFPTTNEFGDWDTVLHTFTFANAVEQGLRRSTSMAFVRGIFDAATSVHLDRFLNVPAARLPHGNAGADANEIFARASRRLRPAATRRRGRDARGFVPCCGRRRGGAHCELHRGENLYDEIDAFD